MLESKQTMDHWQRRSRNLVRFCRHLPEETLDASFAADFAFRDTGSRYMFLKSVGSTPGPDECWGLFARDARSVFAKLLGMRLAYDGLPDAHCDDLRLYNSMNYYRSHIEEYFCHNGMSPLPPVLGTCLMWFPARDRLHVRYTLQNQSRTAVPLRLQWFAVGEAGREGRWQYSDIGPVFSNQSEVAGTTYQSRVLLTAASTDIGFAIDAETATSTWLAATIPPAGVIAYDFTIRFAFNDEPWPELPADWSQASHQERITAYTAACDRLPELAGPRHEPVVLNAMGTLRTLRYEDSLPSGEQIMTIHAGKTGCAATWFWDSGFTLLGLGVAADRKTGQGALRILTDGIAEDGTPPVTYECGAFQPGYQLPILAWGAGHFLAMQPDHDFLTRIYPALVRYVNNWLGFRQDSGLVIYPAGETSLDDSLRWHTGFPLEPAPDQPWHEQEWGRARQELFESPDVNAFLYLELMSLAAMADVLDKAADAGRWRQLGHDLAQAINEHLFDPDSQVYHDRHMATGAFTGMVNLGSFIPFFAGLASPEATATACRRYLLDNTHFLTPFPFPVVDRAHPTFRHGGVLYEPPAFPGALVQQAYWRGRTWLHCTYWFLGALCRAGLVTEADEVCDRILEGVGRNEGIAECYDSLTGYPNGHNEFMWSAAAVLTLAYRHYHRDPVATLV